MSFPPLSRIHGGLRSPGQEQEMRGLSSMLLWPGVWGGPQQHDMLSGVHTGCPSCCREEKARQSPEPQSPGGGLGTASRTPLAPVCAEAGLRGQAGAGQGRAAPREEHMGPSRVPGSCSGPGESRRLPSLGLSLYEMGTNVPCTAVRIRAPGGGAGLLNKNEPPRPSLPAPERTTSLCWPFGDIWGLEQAGSRGELGSPKAGSLPPSWGTCAGLSPGLGEELFAARPPPPPCPSDFEAGAWSQCPFAGDGRGQTPGPSLSWELNHNVQEPRRPVVAMETGRFSDGAMMGWNLRLQQERLPRFLATLESCSRP
nr:uncharacterized protein LOC105859884 [Microcebus murinus]